MHPESEAPPLLSWDGGVVAGAPQGTATTGTSPSRGLEPSGDSRVHIIELYQEVLDERDALLGEVEALSAALDEAQEMFRQTRAHATELELRIAALSEGQSALAEENADMAARLTTAQIRRLEAEKILLETRIAWHKERLTGGTVSAGAPAVAGRTGGGGQ